MARISNSRILTPVKAVKNQAQVLTQRDKVANDLYSRAVSVIRQPSNHCSTGSSKKQIFKERQRRVLPGDCQFMSLAESRLLLFS